jgi:hypothetical protein
MLYSPHAEDERKRKGEKILGVSATLVVLFY